MSKFEAMDVPELIPVNPTKREETVYVPDMPLYVHPKEGVFVSETVAESFAGMDAEYGEDKKSWIEQMATTSDTIRVQRRAWSKPKVDIGYMTGPDVDSDELMVISSPLNDGKQKSDPDALYRFLDIENPSLFDKQRAKPNSWGPVTKLDTGYEILRRQGLGMAMLQVYSRIAPRTFTLPERRRIVGGDLAPYARVFKAAIDHASEEKHKKFGTGPYEKVHFFGAGLGHVALIVANTLRKDQDDFEVASGTAMNLIMGKETRREAFGEHTVNQEAGEASDFVLPNGYVKVKEPQVRKDIDGKGAEPSMYLRQVPPMVDFLGSRPLIKSTPHTASAVNGLVGNDVFVTVANSYNSSLVNKTKENLPIGHPNLWFSDIVGVEGYKPKMMSNEHAALVGIVMALGVRNARDHQARS